jgi:hypothetical protein
VSSRRYHLLLISAAVLIVSALTFVMTAAADPDEPGVSNAFCLDCHGDPSTTMTLENGDTISLYIDAEVFEGSVHGEEGYACVQCHTDIRDYPHPAFSAFDPRDLSLDLYEACFRCHSGQYERALDSVHERALENGMVEAAICTDCHGAHDTRRLTNPQTGQLLLSARTHIPETCSQCHNAIYQKYVESVHGSALTEENNQDVPTCIDCHGVHNIEDPTTARFRLLSPQICANCHTNASLMRKYGLSTEVLNTYVSDFHGTTVTIFQKVTPDAATNKAVCYDCHGVHDIRRVDDPEKGLQVRENLLARCQVCHPDATIQFSDSWLSHYIPSPERNALVYYVNLFYKILIPGVLAGMGALVALDASWQIRHRFFKPRPEKPGVVQTPEPLSKLDATREQIWGGGDPAINSDISEEAGGEKNDRDAERQQGDNPSGHE